MPHHTLAIRGRTVYRTLLGILYCALMARFVLPPDPAVFVGAPHIDEYAGVTGMEDNLGFIVFMLFGTLLSLGQPAEYLMRPNPFVFIRRGRSWGRLARCRAATGGYCVTFAGAQLVITVMLFAVLPAEAFPYHARGFSFASLASGAIWSALMLLILLLSDVFATLVGHREQGWLWILAIVALCAILPAIQHACMDANPLAIPNWVLLFPLAIAALVIAITIAYQHTELLTSHL
ncbi:hypothetical protein BLEM_1087 [Bifidobacterium lemurum]|uniref:Uncharacterized protein n=1 Tax=Bifidobacterium lemurum TaxID=1603886 RepID=A0A261FTL3_9BIFI|nr:hypothetical protein [Bifidobacterium lemurum]OZG62541.1 hypothetical protein BLEM_1087 [Bifidobacterium lemurum]QOL33875.1 hypothetical protein BL8807_08895 [Bifidobacterium lemurum]